MHVTHKKKIQMEITLLQLQSYLFAIEQIPTFTPKRWDLISECVTKLSAGTSKSACAEPTIKSLSGGEGGDFSEALHSDVSAKLVVNGGGRPFVPKPQVLQGSVCNAIR